ncbi:hypothetical protein ACLESO_03045 [Pyxidicoccus sp. 3LG]
MLLPDGRVLVAGGSSATDALDSAEVFDDTAPRCVAAARGPACRRAARGRLHRERGPAARRLRGAWGWFPLLRDQLPPGPPVAHGRWRPDAPGDGGVLGHLGGGERAGRDGGLLPPDRDGQRGPGRNGAVRRRAGAGGAGAHVPSRAREHRDAGNRRDGRGWQHRDGDGG